MIFEEPKYTDKFGNLISCKEIEILIRDREYKFIKQETIGDYWISTVWLPFAYGINMDEHFETMVFTNHGKPSMTYSQGSVGDEEECVRYGTLQEAIDGHEEVVKRYKHERAITF